MSTWEERMGARSRARRKAYDANNLHAVIQRNAYFYPRRLAFEARAEGCNEPDNCYEVKPDGNSGRWMAFHIDGGVASCEHEHHKGEIWLA